MAARAPKAAMILAAGLGIRMRPLTDDRPKPLIEIRGRALLDYAIDRLVDAGVETVVVNVHYKAEMIEEHLARRRDARFIISDERNRLMDTGGGVVKALPHLGPRPFLTHNSDFIWREDGPRSNLTRLIESFDPDRMDACMLLVPRERTLGLSGPGDFFLGDDGRLRRRGDSPTCPYYWNGVQMVHPRLFADPPEGPFSTNILWDRAIAKGRLFGLELMGQGLHVGTPEAVGETERYLDRFGYQ